MCVESQTLGNWVLELFLYVVSEADFCGWSTGAYPDSWQRTSGASPYFHFGTGPEQAVEGDWYMFLSAYPGYPAYNKAGSQDGG